MKKLFIASVMAIVAVSLSACNSHSVKGTSEYAKTVAEAKATHAKAKSMGNVWKQKKMKKSYVDSYIGRSQTALKKGKNDKALKYAKLALKTAKAELKQSEDYKNITPSWSK